jgi:hypothetical protein
MREWYVRSWEESQRGLRSDVIEPRSSFGVSTFAEAHSALPRRDVAHIRNHHDVERLLFELHMHS